MSPTLEPIALVLAAASMLAMLRFEVGMAWTLAASALVGVVYRKDGKSSRTTVYFIDTGA